MINSTFQPKWSANGPGTGPHARPPAPSIRTTCDQTNHDPHKPDAGGRDDVGEVGSDGTLVNTAAQLNTRGPVQPGAWSLSSAILVAFYK